MCAAANSFRHLEPSIRLRHSLLAWMATGLIAGLLGFVATGSLQGQQRIGPSAGSNKWETLGHCRLLEKGWRDGDSFHVQKGDREYVFRLYFVDAPETDFDHPDRVKEQAAYFGLNAAQTLEVGRDASRFTGRQLSGEFTVITRWENARGQGNLTRYYGIVMADGKNLSAELVRNGLARIEGKMTSWPGGPIATEFVRELKKLEQEAKDQHRGAWDEKRYPRSSGAKDPVAVKRSLVDLNLASIGELETLPGIGKTMAERIIAHRPYATVDELRKVNGIGVKTLEKLRPLVTVEPNQKAK